MAGKNIKKATATTKTTATKATLKPMAENLSYHYTGLLDFFKSHWIFSALIIAVAFVIYGRTMQYGYVLDDLIVIQENNFTKKGFSGIMDILTTESFTGYFGEKKDLVQGNRYRPLSIITFAIEQGIFGKENPGFSHLINILLYGLTGIVLFRLLLLMLGPGFRIFKGVNIPVMATSLFMVHPLHVEAVANIKGRDEIMVLLFSLLCLYYMIKYAFDKKNQQLIWANLFLMLALLSKENAITFLAVIPLTLYTFTNNSLWSSLKLTATPMVTAIVYLLWRFSVAGVPEFGKEIPDLMNNPFLGMKGGEKSATIFYTLWMYIKLLVFPHPLSHDYYPYAIPVMNWGSLKSIGSLLLHAGIAYVGIRNFKKQNIVSWSVFYYLITLSIVSNFVINLGTFMNDRFIYMSSVGYAVIVAYGLYKMSAWKKLPQASIVSLLIFSIVTGLYTFRSYTRVPDWKDAIALNESAVVTCPNSARANSFMATAFFNKYKETQDKNEQMRLLNEAYPYAEKAVEIFPKYLNGNIMVSGIAAEIFKQDRDVASILSKFEEVAQRRPDVPFLTEFLKYLNGTVFYHGELVGFYNRVADHLLQQNNVKWAGHYLNLGLEIGPEIPEIHERLSIAYERSGDANNAAKHKSLAQKYRMNGSR
jgi:protein O-mannosyl-transferase